MSLNRNRFTDRLSRMIRVSRVPPDRQAAGCFSRRHLAQASSPPPSQAGVYADRNPERSVWRRDLQTRVYGFSPCSPVHRFWMYPLCEQQPMYTGWRSANFCCSPVYSECFLFFIYKEKDSIFRLVCGFVKRSRFFAHFFKNLHCLYVFFAAFGIIIIEFYSGWRRAL